MNILTLNSKVARLDAQQVFVYGTLKKGYGNYERHLRDAKFLGQAQVEGIMFHLGGFPAISLAEKYTRIIGEVYQCSWEDVLAMDQLEGVDHGFYSRVEIAVFPYKKAWTYVFTHGRASLEKWVIPSGIWRGPDTPKLAWAGWGKGVLVGAFETDRQTNSILVGEAGKTEFRLNKNQAHGTYDLIRTVTGEILGTYRNLGEMIRDGKSSTTLSLPPRQSTNAAEEVKKTIYRQAAGDVSNYNPPSRQTILENPPVPYITEAQKQSKESQAERFLGIKAREA